MTWILLDNDYLYLNIGTQSTIPDSLGCELSCGHVTGHYAQLESLKLVKSHYVNSFPHSVKAGSNKKPSEIM
jgi:hypothetical protein